MLPPIFTWLKASDVYDMVGTRIYRHGSAPQDVTRPYVTWFIVSGLPDNNLSDTPDSDRYSVQVDCWSMSDAEVETIASAVRDAIETNAHMTSIVINEREPGTKLYRIGMQFDIMQNRV